MSFTHGEGDRCAQAQGSPADYEAVVLVVRRPDVQRVRPLGWTRPALALARTAVVLAALALTLPLSALAQDENGKPKTGASTPKEQPAGFQKDTTPLAPEITGATPTGGPTGGGQAGVSGGSASRATSTASIVRLVVGLAVVLGVVYGLYWLLRAHARGKGKLIVADDRLRVLAATPLGPNRALHLVKIADELVLVGTADGAIAPVKTWSASESRRIESVLEGDVSAVPFRAMGDPVSGSGRLLEQLRRRTTRS